MKKTHHERPIDHSLAVTGKGAAHHKTAVGLSTPKFAIPNGVDEAKIVDAEIQKFLAALRGEDSSSNDFDGDEAIRQLANLARVLDKVKRKK